MSVKVKICGLRTREAVEAADSHGAEFIGFVFCDKSPRNISPIEAGKISKNVNAKKVAVTVNASDELLDEIITHLKPDFIQFHGSESDERASEIKTQYSIKIIKALSPNTKNLTPAYDFYLFDSPGGGTGKQFDYNGFKAPSQPWFLSGGLNIENLEDAVITTGAKYVDVSSGVESERGVKDIGKIIEFLNKAHDIN